MHTILTGSSILVLLAPLARPQTSYTPSNQFGNISATITSFPTTFPWTTLLPKSSTNPDGYDHLHNSFWPVKVNVGDLDVQPGLDVLFTVGERTLLAVGFNRNAAGVPISAYPIWVLHDPLGDSQNGLWKEHRSVVADLDGDGLDEVAWLGRVPYLSGSDLEVQVVEDFAHVALSSHPTHPGTMVPNIAARWSLTQHGHAGWINRMKDSSAESIAMQPGDIRGLGLPMDVLLTSSDGGETKVLAYDAGLAQLSLVAAVPYIGNAVTHDPRVADLDGDGDEELLSNGVISFTGGSWQSCLYYGSPAPGWACGNHSWDHADDIAPIGFIDGDAVQDLVIVDDLFTKIAPGAFSSGPLVSLAGLNVWMMPPASFLVHNTTTAPTVHGQGITVGRFLAGNDVFNQPGPQMLFVPKGGPYYNGTGVWGTYLANRNLDTLAESFGAPSSTPTVGNGPTGWNPRNFDWDGDVTTDELLNSNHQGVISVFRLGAAASGSYPYAWQKVAEISPWNLWGANFPPNSMFADFAADFFGDEREELIIPGPRQVVFVANANSNTLAGKRRSPHEAIEYRRRFSSQHRRYVDYQALPTLERIELVPASFAMAPGSTSLPLTVIGHYTDGGTADVTAHAQLTSNGIAASLVGNQLVSANDVEGLVAVQATVAGVSSDQPCLCNVSANPAPRVLHAGWADTRIVAGTPGDVVVEAAIADPDGDVLAVGLLAGSSTITFGFVDDGSGSDRVADDGIWTAVLAGFVAPVAADAYYEVVAVDAAFHTSNVWPYQNIAGGTAPAVPGVPLMPYPSETFGATGVGPRLASIGVIEASIDGAGGGSIVLGARVTDPSVDAIHVFLAGTSPGPILNDSGLAGDLLAGDGLWSATVSVPAGSLAPGNHVFDMVPFSVSTPSPSGDAYPRLRAHFY